MDTEPRRLRQLKTGALGMSAQIGWRVGDVRRNRAGPYGLHNGAGKSPRLANRGRADLVIALVDTTACMGPNGPPLIIPGRPWRRRDRHVLRTYDNYDGSHDHR